MDGKPVQAPKLEREKTVFELDNKFDAGSGISLDGLSKVQIDNLATLGQGVGLSEISSPARASGQLHWDYELLRVLPAILQASDRAAANAAMAQWIAGLGAVDRCNPCAKLDESDLHLRPDVSWLEDETMLGAALSQSLLSIYRNRPGGGRQFYLTLGNGAQQSLLPA